MPHDDDHVADVTDDGEVVQGAWVHDMTGLPDVAAQGVKSVNINLTFEEALKLNLALDSCVHSINRYHRGTKKGTGKRPVHSTLVRPQVSGLPGYPRSDFRARR